MINQSQLQSLLNEHEVAGITGMSLASVRRWRLIKEGPKYIKIGAAVRYKPEDVSAWLASCPTGGGPQMKVNNDTGIASSHRLQRGGHES